LTQKLFFLIRNLRYNAGKEEYVHITQVPLQIQAGYKHDFWPLRVTLPLTSGASTLWHKYVEIKYFFSYEFEAGVVGVSRRKKKHNNLIRVMGILLFLYTFLWDDFPFNNKPNSTKLKGKKYRKLQVATTPVLCN